MKAHQPKASQEEPERRSGKPYRNDDGHPGQGRDDWRFRRLGCNRRCRGLAGRGLKSWLGRCVGQRSDRFGGLGGRNNDVAQIRLAQGGLRCTKFWFVEPRCGILLDGHRKIGARGYVPFFTDATNDSNVARFPSVLTPRAPSITVRGLRAVPRRAPPCLC